MHLKGNHSARVGFLTRQGPDMKPKRTSFDAAALRVLEELVDLPGLSSKRAIPFAIWKWTRTFKRNFARSSSFSLRITALLILINFRG